MIVWMIWIQGDDTTWLEAAWDDDSTAGNDEGWKNEVARCRSLANANNYELRIQRVKVPGVGAMFKIPEATAVDASL